ncbi:cytochrome b [Thiomicrospira microaerophila]|uniref:cytochrome b n=1 Tax=Thiomicrospira microaerophila TaxID=406020 RepID=UPI00200FF5B5|nr:cytochrome b [Thiomicrospira microaerophila]UQB42148.1 cytochrome b [Thiomicrospira microaerophila]
MWRNQSNHYGIIHITLHWLIALVVFGLFALGLWMTQLDYYSPYYRSAPDLHRSIGLLVVMAMLLRFAWKQLNPKVQPLAQHARWETWLARIVHSLMYLLVIGLGITGYMISTAHGQPLMLFDWLAIPAIDFGIDYQEELAGDWHERLAWSLMLLVGIHLLGALKHHFIDKDSTLKRMISYKN